jgi:pyruvate/2-oxoglutarate dehydrogenase complex dihydrolipoamide dehydrogenase (E3) component
MPQPERFDVLVLGSGTGGKLIAWHMARSGQCTAVVERRWIGVPRRSLEHVTSETAV